MPTTESGLPFSGTVPISKHTSWKGAEDAKDRALPQGLRYLALLKARYPDGLTDQEAADRLGIYRTTINARRGECVKAGLVEAHGTREGLHGVDNVIWRWAR